MFEDNNSFLPQIKQYLLRISSDTRVRLGVFVSLFFIGVFSVGYGVVSLVASGRVESQPCVVEAPEAYLLAQEVRNANRDSGVTSGSGEEAGVGSSSGSEFINGKNMIYVDVSGAVVNPGIYQMKVGERMAVALELAGGVVIEGKDSKKADLVYLSKEINLAKEVIDGDKIYIPFLIESNNGLLSNTQNEIDGSNITTSDKNVIENSQNNKISLNNSSMKELMELVGVGEKRAEDIISNRPYSYIGDVVEKGAISQSVFDKNKELISL